MPPNHGLALEYNLDGLNGVSFDKGCYVGQEMTARSKFVLVVRKRAVPLVIRRLDQSNPTLLNPLLEQDTKDIDLTGGEVPLGVTVTAPGERRAVGKIFSVVPEGEGTWRGIGICRLGVLWSGVDETLGIDGGETGLVVKAVRPEWWREEWGG